MKQGLGWGGPSNFTGEIRNHFWSCGLVGILYVYKDHITNEEVRKQIQQSIGPFDDLLTTVKKQKQTEVVWICSKVGRACQDNLREADRDRDGTSENGQA